MAKKLLFVAKKGWASALVLIFKRVPFNDTSSPHYPLRNGARGYFQSSYVQIGTCGGFLGETMSKLFCKKTFKANGTSSGENRVFGNKGLGLCGGFNIGRNSACLFSNQRGGDAPHTPPRKRFNRPIDFTAAYRSIGGIDSL